MFIRPPVPLLKLSHPSFFRQLQNHSRSLWGFSTSNIHPRIFEPVRQEYEFENLLSLPLGPTGRSPLLTFWSASLSSESEIIVNKIKALLTNKTGNLGKELNGIGFVEVIASELAQRYMLDSIPMLIAFERSMAQFNTRVTNMEKLMDVEFLEAWIRERAAGR